MSIFLNLLNVNFIEIMPVLQCFARFGAICAAQFKKRKKHLHYKYRSSMGVFHIFKIVQMVPIVQTVSYINKFQLSWKVKHFVSFIELAVFLRSTLRI